MSEDETARAQARVGTTLRGKYRLDRLLGVGGMAAVYEATHRIRSRVALKVLHPHMSTNADVRARFLREGYVANTVGHPGAVKVLDDDTTEDGLVFLAMELLEGETLDAWWRRSGGHVPVREVAKWMHQLVDVLAAAHSKGIVHRDIKPENLFLTREGVLKVLDFGIARLASAGALQDTSKSATKTGRMFGSPAFMGPEQALGLQREIDGQTDLWSVGATMFTLVSGQFVHDAETVEMLLVYAGSRPARRLRTVAPDTPAPIAAVVDRALATSKAERWDSARTMETALEAAYLESYGEPIPGARSVARISKTAFDKTADASPGTSPSALDLALQPTVPEPTPPVAPTESAVVDVAGSGGDETLWVKTPGGQVHQVTMAQVKEALQAGLIDENSMVLARRAIKWAKLGEVTGLSKPVHAVQAPVPNAPPLVGIAPNPLLEGASFGSLLPSRYVVSAATQPRGVSTTAGVESGRTLPVAVPVNRRWIYVAIGTIVIIGGGAAVAVTLATDEDDAAKPSPAGEVATSPLQSSPANVGAPGLSPQPADFGGPCRAGMAWLAAGSFKMRDRKDRVEVQPFCMDLTEVTADAYGACVDDRRCNADHLRQTTDDGTAFADDARCNYDVSGRGSHPMNCVDWQQSVTYCRVQGKSLPTEEEWEWAARGGSKGLMYPWGDAAPENQLCWSGGMQKRDGTCATGSFHGGDALGGIHDLAGNVSEWTVSDFDGTIIRGGAWNSSGSSGIRAADRDKSVPMARYSTLGFRCVL